MLLEAKYEWLPRAMNSIFRRTGISFVRDGSNLKAEDSRKIGQIGKTTGWYRIFWEIKMPSTGWVQSL